jgi:hypothetical protein
MNFSHALRQAYEGSQRRVTTLMPVKSKAESCDRKVELTAFARDHLQAPDRSPPQF